MKVFTVALASTLLAGSALLGAAPAFAQAAQSAAQPAAAAETRKYSLSKPEQAAVGALIKANNAANAAQQAGQTPDWAAVRALVPAADAAARGNDARYLVARTQLSIALATSDLDGQERALAALIASPATPAAEQAVYRTAVGALINKRAEAAFAANDFAAAERLFRQLLEANPDDTRLQNNLRIVQQRSGNTAGAVESALAQIRAAEAAGGRASEELYRSVFATYFHAQQRPQAMDALAALIRNYPTPGNVQIGLSLVRETNDQWLLVDALRFARAAGAIQNTQYWALASELHSAGLPGETVAVLDAGIAAGAITRAQANEMRATAQRRVGEDRVGLPRQIAQARRDATGRSARIVADALYGYGRFAEAAELYRAALTKGGEDAGLVNTRLGASLALAGDRAGAEAAFGAVTGPRAELAQLWLAWLGRRAS